MKEFTTLLSQLLLSRLVLYFSSVYKNVSQVPLSNTSVCLKLHPLPFSPTKKKKKTLKLKLKLKFNTNKQKHVLEKSSLDDDSGTVAF